MTSDTRTGPVPADHSIRDHRDLGLLIEAPITRLACGRIRDLHVSCSEGRDQRLKKVGREEDDAVPTERQIQETVARCVGIMVSFHNAARTPQAQELMTAEIRIMADSVAEWSMGVAEVDGLILRPVEAELHARYGLELGPRLNRLFLEAFDDLDASCERS